MPEARPAICRAAYALMGCLLIVGCGGGGGGGGETIQPAGASPPQTANPPVSPSASVEFSATALTLTGDTDRNVNPIDSTIRVTLQNRPPNGVWTRATSADPALYSANVNWSTETEGRLQVVPRTPRSLGAGTYNVTVQVEVCSDAQCASQIAGSPVSIAVTYVVTGSATPLSRAVWNTAQLNGTPFHTNQTTSPELSMRLSVQDAPVAGLYVRHRRLAGNSVFASVVLNQVATNTYVWTSGDFTVTLKAPAALGSGEFRDSIEFDVCYDAACTRSVEGGAHTAEVGFLVLATEGVEYTRRSVTPPNGASEVVWSAANQSFYILSNRDAPRYSNPGVDPQIARVDPTTLQLGFDGSCARGEPASTHRHTGRQSALRSFPDAVHGVSVHLAHHDQRSFVVPGVISATGPHHRQRLRSANRSSGILRRYAGAQEPHARHPCLRQRGYAPEHHCAIVG